VPLTVDELIYASSIVMLNSVRRKVPVLAGWLLVLSNAASRRSGRHAARDRITLSDWRWSAAGA
jgi:hypothetical protein